MSTELFERHRALLELAQGALATRTAFSAYPENPAEYSEVLGAEGSEAFAKRIIVFYAGFFGCGSL